MQGSKTTLLLLVGLTLTFTIGILVYSQMGEIPLKMMIIYGLVGLVALISMVIAIRKMKEEKEGQPPEDEFTTQLKYKSGFYAYIASLYMWLFFFLFRDLFPDMETLVGGGILLSGVIGFVCKAVVRHQLHDQ